MKFQQWPKRDPNKNYFMVPNEIFNIGLDYREISLYAYLLRCENRETYQCWPSYKTIGHAIGMSENTVAKYVRQLEEKGLIRTEQTTIRSKDGRPLNGNLLYTICAIQAAIELFCERQFLKLEEDAARQKAMARLAKSARESPQNALCASLRENTEPDTPSGSEARFGPISETLPGTKEKAGEPRGRKYSRIKRGGHRVPSARLTPPRNAGRGTFARGSDFGRWGHVGDQTA